MRVHSALGPGLLEKAYCRCLAYELQSVPLLVESELCLPVTYAGIKIDAAYRVDFRIADLVLVEVKPLKKFSLFTAPNCCRIFTSARPAWDCSSTSMSSTWSTA
jgi:GxxExxY protein